MVTHRDVLIYANAGMRDAYSEEHVRAERAEADRDAAVRLLKECRPHVVNTKRCLPDNDEGD